jgi:hypothetical protein
LSQCTLNVIARDYGHRSGGIHRDRGEAAEETACRPIDEPLDVETGAFRSNAASIRSEATPCTSDQSGSSRSSTSVPPHPARVLECDQRLEQACRTTGHELLASKPLLDRTGVPDGIVISIGSHVLRGEWERLELLALQQRTRGPIDRHDSAAEAFAEGDSAGRKHRHPPRQRRLLGESRAGLRSAVGRGHGAVLQLPGARLYSCDLHDKQALKGDVKANIAIASSYNDMLSALGLVRKPDRPPGTSALPGCATARC